MTTTLNIIEKAYDDGLVNTRPVLTANLIRALAPVGSDRTITFVSTSNLQASVRGMVADHASGNIYVGVHPIPLDAVRGISAAGIGA